MSHLWRFTFLLMVTTEIFIQANVLWVWVSSISIGTYVIYGLLCCTHTVLIACLVNVMEDVFLAIHLLMKPFIVLFFQVVYQLFLNLLWFVGMTVHSPMVCLWSFGKEIYLSCGTLLVLILWSHLTCHFSLWCWKGVYHCLCIFPLHTYIFLLLLI